MDALLRKEILDLADLMGLAHDSKAVLTALETAALAMAERYGSEVAMDLAREALRTTPAA